MKLAWVVIQEQLLRMRESIAEMDLSWRRLLGKAKR